MSEIYENEGGPYADFHDERSIAHTEGLEIIKELAAAGRNEFAGLNLDKETIHATYNFNLVDNLKRKKKIGKGNYGVAISIEIDDEDTDDQAQPSYELSEPMTKTVIDILSDEARLYLAEKLHFVLRDGIHTLNGLGIFDEKEEDKLTKQVGALYRELTGEVM